MATPRQIQIASKSPAAGDAQQFDAPKHPEKGLVRGYPLRVIADITADNNISPTPDDWRETLLPTFFPTLQMFAPRYNKQMCSADLDGKYWARLYEDLYKQRTPMRVEQTPVDDKNLVEITAVAQKLTIDFMLCPFETPALGADRLLTAVPASLMRGDVGLTAKWIATCLLNGVTLTLANLKFLWQVQTSLGNNSRVPVVHTFEKKNIGSDSADIGRGCPRWVIEEHAPTTANEAAISYDLSVDGELIHNGDVSPQSLLAAYTSSRRKTEDSTLPYTPLFWTPSETTVDEIEVAERSLTVKINGDNSLKVSMATYEPASGAVINNLKAALGLSRAMRTVQPPETPKTAAAGNVNLRVSKNGARTMLVDAGGGRLVPPAGASKTGPSVPHGTFGSALANSLRPTRKTK